MSNNAIPIEVKVVVDRREQEVNLRMNANEESYDVDFDETIEAGTRDYNRLKNKPSINNNELIGDKTFEQLGLESLTNEDIENLLRMAGGF